MKYKNAYEGMKKIVAAEALQIISAGLAIIVALLGVTALTGAAAAADGSEAGAVGAVASGLGVVLLSLGIAVLGIISVIFMIIGLKKASEDEPKYFKNAFIMSVLLLIANLITGLAGVIPFLGTIASVLKTFLNVATIAVYVFTVMGISTLAKNLGRDDVVSMGNVILVIEVVQIVLATIATFTNGILLIVATIISLIGYIIYLVYLTKGKKMLEA